MCFRLYNVITQRRVSTDVSTSLGRPCQAKWLLRCDTDTPCVCPSSPQPHGIKYFLRVYVMPGVFARCAVPVLSLAANLSQWPLAVLQQKLVLQPKINFPHRPP